MFNGCFLSTFLNKIQLVIINVTLFSPFFQETIEQLGSGISRVILENKCYLMISCPVPLVYDLIKIMWYRKSILAYINTYN